MQCEFAEKHFASLDLVQTFPQIKDLTKFIKLMTNWIDYWLKLENALNPLHMDKKYKVYSKTFSVFCFDKIMPKKILKIE